ncbi:MAG: phosphonate C-P lyase system protein PhnH [Rubritepida sp.]|jgi:alpha-D-ribose 1-methylphosphonate 5-triphosphate synthase subunit PhnH|nr:phosphonate C-P lyase system protein PhnH [Rubritepida sp.]
MRAGFADPVTEAQAAFRAAMDALARPGRVQCVAGPEAPPPLAPAAAALLLALADADTPVWTDAGPEAEAWIAFHTGAPLVPAPGAAAFLLAAGPMPPLATLAAGTDEAPQEGATLIQQVAALTPGAGWGLAGPGIATTARLGVEGLPADFPAQWAANAARFPRGVDLFLCAGAALAAFPRTLRLDGAR